MVILRKRPNLFWVSENLGLDQYEVDPVVPINFLTQKKIIDWKTKRIQLYDSLSDAISVYSLGGKDISGMTLGVYRPRGIKEDYKNIPNFSNCPYSIVLDGEEYWCLFPLDMIKICDIKIEKKIGNKEFRVGDRAKKLAGVDKSSLGVYRWKEILPEWDKKGKTRKL